MSNRVNQHQSACLAYRRRRYREGRGRTAMGFHRGRPLTPVGARCHIVPPGWGGGSAGSSKQGLLGAQPGGLRDSRLLLGASAASSVGPTTASSYRHAVRASCSATPRRAGASGAFLPTLARRSQRGPREFC